MPSGRAGIKVPKITSGKKTTTGQTVSASRDLSRTIDKRDHSSATPTREVPPFVQVRHTRESVLGRNSA